MRGLQFKRFDVMPASSENELAVTEDGVTCVRWEPQASSRLLLSSSWDGSIRLHDTSANLLRAQLQQPAPVLDVDFLGDASRAVSGSLDGGVRLHGLGSGGETVLGSHTSAVRCVRHCAALGPNAVVSGSWDHHVKLWDVRVADACVGTFEQPDKILSMCAGAPSAPAASGLPMLVVATAGRQVVLLDLRKPGEALQRRESSLKCQTRCIAQMPSGAGYTIGSVEGRVAVEYVDPSAEAQQRKYAFKAHRMQVGGVDTCFPVNAIAFHPRHGTFATGGCDGNVYVWDGDKKKRICVLRRYPTSIAALAFSADGEALAVAASYTYENGDVAHPPDAIYVRAVAPSEVKSKAAH